MPVVTAKDGTVYNVDPSAYNASELTITTPEVVVAAPRKRPEMYSSAFDPYALTKGIDWVNENTIGKVLGWAVDKTGTSSIVLPIMSTLTPSSWAGVIKGYTPWDPNNPGFGADEHGLALNTLTNLAAIPALGKVASPYLKGASNKLGNAAYKVWDSSKLADKAAEFDAAASMILKSRRFASLKPDYVPGLVGWAPPGLGPMEVYHYSRSPFFEIQDTYPGRWDAKYHNAPKQGMWTSEKVDAGFLNNRPVFVTLKLKLEKPMILLGDINTPTKNATRDQVLEWAKKNGADGVKFQDIVDNGDSHQNVDFVFKPTKSLELIDISSPIVDLLERNKQMELTGQGSPAERYAPILNGILDYSLYIRKSPIWLNNAMKDMSYRDAVRLRNFESNLASDFSPYAINDTLFSSAAGKANRNGFWLPTGQQSIYQTIEYNPIHTNDYVRLVGAHEAGHMSTLIYAPDISSLTYKSIMPLLKKQYENAQKLSDLLVLNQEAKDVLDGKSPSLEGSVYNTRDMVLDRIAYLKDPQEIHTRGVNEQLYEYSGHKKGLPNRQVYEEFFTPESVNNMIKNVYTWALPISGGAYTISNNE